MNIELVKEEVKKEESLPEKFCLTDFGNITNKGYTLEKAEYEKWLPEPKPEQPLNWIVQEILEDVSDEPSATAEEFLENTDSCESGPPKNSVVVREYTVTALPTETGEQIDISNVIYPMVNDPFTMGRIACAALLNKLFSMKLYTCNRAVFMLAICNKWSQSEQDIVEKTIFDGFKRLALEANVVINEAEVHTDTVCMIGGMLSTIRPSNHLGFSNKSVIGDVIVLTKPLGIQITLDAYKILQQEQSDIRDRLIRVISEEDLSKAYEGAIELLTTLNLYAINLTDTYEVHAATEINGQSLMEHTQLLAEKQINEVAFYIYNLPLIAKTVHISKVFGNQMDLIQGNIPEVSGGLLLVMPREQAATFCRHALNDGKRAWIIGVVEKGQRSANMIKKARVIDWLWKSETNG